MKRKKLHYSKDHYLGYDEIVASFGFRVRFKADSGDYQGENVWILSPWRVLIFSFGSCSYCDWAEGVDSQKNLDDLVERMRTSIRSFKTKVSLLRWMKDEGQAQDWYRREAWWSNLIVQVINMRNPRLKKKKV